MQQQSISTPLVGLTGGIGSGKTQVSDGFAALGVPVIDADVVSRALTADGGEALPLIRAAFGAEVFAQSAVLDRAALRERVFADEAAKTQLEAILHPLILQKIALQHASLASTYAILSVPLLVEKKTYLSLCRRVLVVDCTEETQIERVRARNGFSRAQVLNIMAQQASRAERLAVADDVVLNEYDLAYLDQEVARLHQFYLTLFKNPVS
ncbi:MAG: dephospho-CoA kinase [Neisseriaceae bacterium]|nr:dephospho-CoA kinase [Neisseriaceae bacterium]MBP6862077.1 dephospho-CoA kinase [Neisseriaceae bacterium]